MTSNRLTIGQRVWWAVVATMVLVGVVFAYLPLWQTR